MGPEELMGVRTAMGERIGPKTNVADAIINLDNEEVQLFMYAQYSTLSTDPAKHEGFVRDLRTDLKAMVNQSGRLAARSRDVLHYLEGARLTHNTSGVRAMLLARVAWCFLGCMWVNTPSLPLAVAAMESACKAPL